MSGNYLDRFAMRKQCGDCAFDPKSEAGRCLVTQTTAQLCVQSGEPFFCHRWQDGDAKLRTDGDGEGVICRGFVDAFVARGHTDDWRAAVASESLRILEETGAGKVISPDDARDRIIAAGERAHLESGN